MAITRMDDWITISQTSASSNLFIQTNSQVCFIYRLPIEILEAIFIHGAYQHYNDAHGHPIPFAPSWVQVSYVSRHWRNVALNCPTLWSYPFITSPRWTKELLARSKQAPLKLHVDMHYYDEKLRGLRFVEQIMNHLERIQELHLHLAFSHYHILSRLSSRASRLQNLEISVECYSSEWSSVPFDGDTPALRTLVLVACPVPWYSLKLHGLTTLNLCRVPVRFQQDMVEFLATLSCMQDLARLTLEKSLASAAGFLSSTAFHTFKKINLPRLSRLLIVAPLSTVFALLSCVNIPVKTEVRLVCQAERSSSFSDDYTPLLPLLAQRFVVSGDQAPSSPTIRSFIVAFDRGRDVAVTFSTSERNRDASISAYRMVWGYFPLQIILPPSQLTTTSNGDHIMSNIFCAVPLTNVQSLHVIKPPFSSAFWTHALGHLQDLRHIKLSHGRMPDLASILSLNPAISRRMWVNTLIEAEIRYLLRHWRSWSFVTLYFRQHRRWTRIHTDRLMCNLFVTLFPPAKSLEVD